MSLRHRLTRLETAAREREPDGDRLDRLNEEDWLDACEAAGREGYFDAEPDFAAALAAGRDALREATEQTDVPFTPPADYMPGLTDQPHCRAWYWHLLMFPDIVSAWDWLAEIVRRVRDSIPPVTECEFSELAEWFRANEERLYRLSLPSQFLDLGGGRKRSTADLRYGVAQGPRTPGAGELAEDLRRLKAKVENGRAS